MNPLSSIACLVALTATLAAATVPPALAEKGDNSRQVGHKRCSAGQRHPHVARTTFPSLPTNMLVRSGR